MRDAAPQGTYKVQASGLGIALSRCRKTIAFDEVGKNALKPKDAEAARVFDAGTGYGDCDRRSSGRLRDSRMAGDAAQHANRLGYRLALAVNDPGKVCFVLTQEAGAA